MTNPGNPSVAEMRSIPLDVLEARDHRRPVHIGGRSQTYRTAGGSVFHLRTRYRDPQAGGHLRYWFGILDHCWVEGQFFVLVCDRDFVLVVPVGDWLPYLGYFSVAKPGTPSQSRQPHILWHPGANTFELVEGDLRLDVTPWLDHFDLMP